MRRERKKRAGIYGEGNVHLEPGAYWLWLPRKEWNTYRKALQGAAQKFRTWHEEERAGMSFVVIDVPSPIAVHSDVVKVGRYERGDTPENLRLVEPEPSIFESIGETVQQAENTARTIKSAVWALAGLTVGMALLRRK